MSLHIHPHAAECPRRQDALDGRAEQARHLYLVSAGDAARWELDRQRKIERMQRVVAWYAAAAVGFAFWYFVIQMLRGAL